MSIQSMTGYGSGQREIGIFDLTVEMKSVNQRFLEVNCKMPASYARFEQDIVRVVKEQLRRGKIDVFVSRRRRTDAAVEAQFQRSQFEGSLQVFEKAMACVATGPETDHLRKATLPLFIANVLQRREITDSDDPSGSVDQEKAPLLECVQEALGQLVTMRSVEGQNLVNELKRYLDDLKRIREDIRRYVPETLTSFQMRLQSRMEQLQLPPDVLPDRLAQEIALLADRTDISEELTRFTSHENQFLQALSTREGGKKLDFLVQEFLRETNTIGSKAQNANITACVVEAKCILEKIKEQVQNLE